MSEKAEIDCQNDRKLKKILLQTAAISVLA